LALKDEVQLQALQEHVKKNSKLGEPILDVACRRNRPNSAGQVYRARK
jgi:hypothetical protein